MNSRQNGAGPAFNKNRETYTHINIKKNLINHNLLAPFSRTSTPSNENHLKVGATIFVIIANGQTDKAGTLFYNIY